MSSVLPLSGVTVVAIEQAVAAPFASRQLADLGARVIKIERPSVGDFARRYDEAVAGLSSHFVWLNRTKESLSLDLKSPEGTAILHKLLVSSDVLIQNLAPGALARLGLAVPELVKRYPRLVICGISGYGDSGPYRRRKAYDLLIQAESGLMSVTGTPDSPVKAGIAVADIAAGMYAFAGIVAALLRRAQTGRGAVVDVAMLDALAEWMGYPIYYTAGTGAPPERTGAHHATIAPYGPYRTLEGSSVVIAVQTDQEWRGFCVGVLRLPDLASDGRFITNPLRLRNRDALDTLINGVVGALPRAHLVARLDANAIAHATVNSVSDLLHHEQLRARQRWRKLGIGDDGVEMLLPPLLIDGTDPRISPVPQVGEHTSAILKEIGYTDAEVLGLRADGVV